jgi:hypothetical protein
LGWDSNRAWLRAFGYHSIRDWLSRSDSAMWMFHVEHPHR